MNLSKTAEYALRIISFMAMDEKKLYTTNEIYDNLQIPFRYLRKLMIKLSKRGILVSKQGKIGGYKIALETSEISVLDIIKATGEDPVGEACFFGFDSCALVEKCAMHDKWALVRQNIYQILSNTTFAEIKESGPQNFINKNSSIFT